MTLRMSVPYFLQGIIPWGNCATRDKKLSHQIRLLNGDLLSLGEGPRPVAVSAITGPERLSGACSVRHRPRARPGTGPITVETS